MRIHARRALLAISAVSLVSATAYASHSWGNYHWARTSNPVTLQVVDAVNSTWDPYLAEAIADWSASKVVKLVPGGTGTNPKKCTAIPGKILACNAAYGQRGWLGIASIWANGDHITQATTKLNDSYFSLSSYNKPEWRRLVTCQEIAHDFGLGHQDEGFSNPNLGSCMDYTNNPLGPPSNEHPNSHDFQQLESIYSHTDSSNSASAAALATDFGVRTVGKSAAVPATSRNDPGDSPAEWGSAVHHDQKGRPDIFVQRQPGGITKITHVLWAPDHPGGQ